MRKLPGHILPLFLLVALILNGCHSSRDFAGTAYYAYDSKAPLNTNASTMGEYGDMHYEVEFSSTHGQRVTGILSYPEQVGPPVPVVILIHGKGDHKQVDYISAGEQFIRNAGYAVLRIDLYNHGPRKYNEFDFSFDGPARYRSREVITQSVFDLRRAVDFIESREELDHNRIGYFGISLGGIIGTIFSGVDDRIKVPVNALAGGQLNLMFGVKKLSEEHQNYLSVMDPINYVERISPRPLLMINAENDEVIPPETSRILFNKAKEPKKIIWYEARHKTIPLKKTYEEGISWFDKHL